MLKIINQRILYVCHLCLCKVRQFRFTSCQVTHTCSCSQSIISESGTPMCGLCAHLVCYLTMTVALIYMYNSPVHTNTRLLRIHYGANILSLVYRWYGVVCKYTPKEVLPKVCNHQFGDIYRKFSSHLKWCCTCTCS